MLTTVASVEQLMYVACSMGLSLLVSAWFFYRVTGGLFNPNITTALALVGAIGPLSSSGALPHLLYYTPSPLAS